MRSGRWEFFSTNFKQRNYFASLDMLRGLAAFFVMLFHFTIHTTITLNENNFLKILGGYGDYGVQVFFMISGLVIPYSLLRANYNSFNDFFIFLTKRIIRIDIPYIVIIILELIFIFISSLTPWAGGNNRIDVLNLLLHLGYLNSFFGQAWLLPIFWTLGIEFQFYLLLGILFPLLNKNKLTGYIALLLFISVGVFININGLLFTYLIFFSLGIALFFLKTNMFSLLEFFFTTLLIVFIIYLKDNSIILSMVLIASVITVIYVENVPQFLSYLGKISFSIYLLHIPVGGRILRLAEIVNFDEVYKMLAIMVSIITTLILSALFYQFIELPALKMAKRIMPKPIS